MLSKSKYIPSKVKSNSTATCYEPYIGCANKPTFSVEISYCYSVKSPATDFEEEKYYSRVIISVPCNSPKEAVNYAMSRWEDETLVGSQFYPPVNTVGEVVEVLSPEFCFVQWPKGAVYSNGALSCPNCFLEKVIDEKVTEHWVPATKDNVKVGSKVRMIDGELHNEKPQWFPAVGTVGIVRKLDYINCEVQWPKGTTSWQDKWWCNYEHLEVLLNEE